MTEAIPTLPVIDEVSRPYWDAARERRLLVQRRPDGALQWPPRGFSRLTLEPLDDWVEVSGAGRIATYTVVHRSSHAHPPVPYVLAVVELREGVSMMTRIVGADPDAVRVGATVTVDFEPLGDDLMLPVFRLAETAT